MLAFVNSFHLFVDASVGATGKSGDNSVMKTCLLMEEIKTNREAWLGVDGMIAADGGASDGGHLLLNPINMATHKEDLWYNFCHSSTRCGQTLSLPPSRSALALCRLSVAC